MGTPGGAVVKNLPTNAGDAEDVVWNPGLGRSPGVVNGNPLQCSCLENPMDRGARQVTVNGVIKSQRCSFLLIKLSLILFICLYLLDLHVFIYYVYFFIQVISHIYNDCQKVLACPYMQSSQISF